MSDLLLRLSNHATHENPKTNRTVEARRRARSRRRVRAAWRAKLHAERLEERLAMAGDGSLALDWLTSSVAPVVEVSAVLSLIHI